MVKHAQDSPHMFSRPPFAARSRFLQHLIHATVNETTQQLLALLSLPGVAIEQMDPAEIG